MPRLVHWEHLIGRRLRLRDLFVFFTVVDSGSMAKAAAKLGVSAPSISEAIADLEETLRVRLVDRGPKGVVATPYGTALLTRGRAAFDELRQGVRDIELISDPHAGELRVGCPEPIAAGFLLPVMEHLTKDYPRVRLHVQQVRQPAMEFQELFERKVDLVVSPLVKAPESRVSRDITVETLFDDRFALVVGEGSKWARRRKVALADLVNEPWVMPPLDTLDAYFSTAAFTAAGAPNFIITTYSFRVRINLVSSGRFITALPRSVLQVVGRQHSLKEIPIKLPIPPYPVAIVTLRNRTVTPLAGLFVERARKVAKQLA